MGTNDPAMRGREPAKPETWAGTIGAAFAWAIALSFITLVCAAAVQAMLGARIP